MNSFRNLIEFCLLSPEFFSKPDLFLLLKNTFDIDSGHLLDTNNVWAKESELFIRQLDYNEKKRAIELFKKLRNFKNGFLDNNHETWNESLVALNHILSSKISFYVTKNHESNKELTNIIGITYPDCIDNDSWKTQHNVLIPRAKKEMRNIVKSLLLYSEKIILIDPHFHPSEVRFLNPLKSWLDVIKQNASCKKIYYIFQDKKDLDLENFKETIENSVIASLLTTFKGKIEFISVGKKIHDRFIITDFLGVNFTYGLDEDNNKKIGRISKTSVSRLSYDSFCTLKNEFDPESDNFKNLIINYNYS